MLAYAELCEALARWRDARGLPTAVRPRRTPAQVSAQIANTLDDQTELGVAALPASDDTGESELDLDQADVVEDEH